VRFFRRAGESLGGRGAGATAVAPERARSSAGLLARRDPTNDATPHADRRAGDPRSRIPPEVLRQIRHIDVRTRGLVNSLFAGEYRSTFKGQGMEFAEVREYQVGDEVRSIDWNVTARMRRPFVRRYEEERELTVVLAVDLSGSERYGTARRFKSELATEIAAVLALSAVRNNDRVGAVLFTDHVEHVVRPRKGRRHALRLLRDVLVYEPEGRGTSVAAAADYLSRLLTHKAIVFIISDFQDAALERPLKRLALRHDVVAVTVEDPGELALPNVGLARFVDPETGAVVERDTADPALRAWFDERVTAEREERRRLLRRLAIDEVPVRTGDGYVEPLLRFFRSRETRARRG